MVALLKIFYQKLSLRKPNQLVALCEVQYFTVLTVFILITHIVQLYNIKILLSQNFNN